MIGRGFIKLKNYITCKEGKISGVGLIRKRDKSFLYKRYFKKICELYYKKRYRFGRKIYK